MSKHLNTPAKTTAPSKILSFICHVPGMAPGAYPAVPTATAAPAGKAADKKPDTTTTSTGGHFTAIYENDRFVRFKYISNN